MTAIHWYRYIRIIVLFVILAFVANRAGGSERPVPVLHRTGDGHLVKSGRCLPAPHAFAGRQRVFSFRWPRKRRVVDAQSTGRRFIGSPRADINTWRVLLIRISFESDRADGLSTLSTGGDFDLTPDGSSIIDPTPHNRSYFNAHMESLKNYYFYQSCGKIDIMWEILPEGENDSYKLSDLADYGPGETEVWTTGDLVRFFRDAVEAADEALAADGYPIRIGDFDALVVAHAGANLQSDIDFDTPNDIPSFYARLGDDDEFSVDGGATVIRNGSVIPETAIQDGFNGGISAVLAHEFGHQIGLPDLYNVYTNGPTVGAWDNMDSGGLLGVYVTDEEDNMYYVEGIIPGGLSAWPRTFLGWTAVDTVDTFENMIHLAAVEKCPAHVVRLDAGQDEYFLIENRAAELDGVLTGFVVDDATGVVIGTGNCLNCESGYPEDPEWELTNGYDILMPTESDIPSYDGGPGILIWHVDERLIAERWEDNTVNSVYPYGITLLEASGVVDLGDPYAYFGLGWYDDAYFDGNNTTLSDSTLPGSWSNWNVPTGVRVEGITARDTLMRFGAGIRDMRWHRKIGPDTGLVAAPHGALLLPGTGRALVIDRYGYGWCADTPAPVFELGHEVMTPAALVHGFTPSGDAVIVGEKRGMVHAFIDDDWTEFDGWPVSLGTSLATFPVVVRHGDGTAVVVTDAAERLHCLNSGGGEMPGFPLELVTGGEYVGNVVVTVGSEGLATGLFTLTGSLEPEPHAWITLWDISTISGVQTASGYPYGINLASGDLEGEVALLGGDIMPNEPGDEVYVVFMSTGTILLCGSEGVLARRNSEGSISSVPAVHDLNGDGYLELIYTDGRSVFAMTPSGANLTGWPRTLVDIYHVPEDVRITAPITTIGTPEGARVVVGTAPGLLYMFDRYGELVDGFPRKMASSFDQAVDLVCIDDRGMLVYYDCCRAAAEYPLELRKRNRTEVKWRLAPSVQTFEGFSWAGVWAGTERGSFAQPSVVGPIDPGIWMDLANSFIVYPNPSSGDRVGFHFTAPVEGWARLEIMTLSGELVAERVKDLSGGEDEFVVSMNGNASGVYICRIVVTSGGRSVEAYRKFAIVN